jgi:hypothetical protein
MGISVKGTVKKTAKYMVLELRNEFLVHQVSPDIYSTIKRLMSRSLLTIPFLRPTLLRAEESVSGKKPSM